MADEHNDVLANPVVIVEALSPGTERYDRGIKFENDRAITSWQDYVLIEPDRVYAEHYTRFSMCGWTLRELRHREQELKLESIGVAMALGHLYERLELPEIDLPFQPL